MPSAGVKSPFATGLQNCIVGRRHIVGVPHHRHFELDRGASSDGENSSPVDLETDLIACLGHYPDSSVIWSRVRSASSIGGRNAGWSKGTPDNDVRASAGR